MLVLRRGRPDSRRRRISRHFLSGLPGGLVSRLRCGVSPDWGLIGRRRRAGSHGFCPGCWRITRRFGHRAAGLLIAGVGSGGVSRHLWRLRLRCAVDRHIGLRSRTTGQTRLRPLHRRTRRLITLHSAAICPVGRRDHVLLRLRPAGNSCRRPSILALQWGCAARFARAQRRFRHRGFCASYRRRWGLS